MYACLLCSFLLLAAPACLAQQEDWQVRLHSRIAGNLVRQQPELLETLHQVVKTKDRYALQALISEIERSGEFSKVLDMLARPGGRDEATAMLRGALESGLAELHHSVKPAASAAPGEKQAAVPSAATGSVVKFPKSKVESSAGGRRGTGNSVGLEALQEARR